MARKIYGNDQVLSHGDYIPLGVEGCRDKAFVSGHFGYEFAKPLMKGRYSFTFLRDPHERLLSLYRFCRARTDLEGELYESARKYDVVGFLKATTDSDCRGHVWNNQVWQLSYGFGADQVNRNIGSLSSFSEEHLLETAKVNIGKFDHVGLVETFDSDARIIFRNLGKRRLKSRRSNVSNAKNKLSELTSETIDILDAVTSLDRCLYEYAVSMRGPSSNHKWQEKLNIRKVSALFNGFGQSR